MGIVVAMETYVTFFGSMQFFINHIGQVDDFQMTLTVDLYLILTLSLTFDLDDLKKFIFFQLFSFYLKSRDVKT